MSSELSLSTDINIITAEINSYKQIAGQSIFEIGKRLKEVRDNPSTYGFQGYRDWENWCNNELEMSRNHANKFVKVAEELGASGHRSLGIKALYEISTLPSEERENPHIVPSTGESKTVDEMTVKEIREVKAELKKKEDELSGERKAKQALLDTIESMKNQKPQQIINNVVKEVTPKHIEEELNKLRKSLSTEKTDNNILEQKVINLEIKKTDLANKLKQIEEYEKSEKAEIDNLKKQKEKLELQAHISISTLQIGIHKFIEEYSPSVFLQGAVASSAGIIKDDLLDSVVALEEFTQKLREILDAKMDKRNIIEIN